MVNFIFIINKKGKTVIVSISLSCIYLISKWLESESWTENKARSIFLFHKCVQGKLCEVLISGVKVDFFNTITSF